MQNATLRTTRSPRHTIHPRLCKRTPLWIASLFVLSGTAGAGTVDLGDGTEMVWSLNASLASGWRTKNPDPNLIGIGDGGTASAYTGFADKNFEKGDNFTTLFRLIGDVDIHRGNTGMVLRAKAWDNYRLSHQNSPYGAPSNNFVPNSRLSDAGFDTELSKFNGLKLLDAYVYHTFDLSETSQMKVRLGNHAVNFGESLFIPGVNQYSVLDINALRQPGTLLKEAILPVPQISADIGGLPGGLSLQGFYQFQWKRTSIDGCGTYWSPATALNCVPGSVLVPNDATPVGAVPSYASWNGIAGLRGANFRFATSPDKEPSDSGQFGLALKKTVEAIDTEFGAYYVNYTTHTPNLSSIRDRSKVPGSAYYASAPLGSVFWDYSAEDIKVAGLSASTVIGGWAAAGELSYTKDFPVQINPVDGFYAFAAPTPGKPGSIGFGPRAQYAGSGAAPLGSGQYIPGFDRKDKVQLQFSTLKILSNVLGASGGSFAGEVAFQHWSGIGDPYTGARYGRGFEYGAAQHSTYGGSCPAMASNPKNCTQDGYFTSNAWGLRALLELEYPGVIPGIVLKPRVFLSQDVKGWSADGLFSQGRRALSLGVKAVYEKKYSVDLSYTKYNSKAQFDNLHDRDFLALVLAASF